MKFKSLLAVLLLFGCRNTFEPQIHTYEGRDLDFFVENWEGVQKQDWGLRIAGKGPGSKSGITLKIVNRRNRLTRITVRNSSTGDIEDPVLTVENANGQVICQAVIQSKDWFDLDVPITYTRNMRLFLSNDSTKGDGEKHIADRNFDISLIEITQVK